MFGKWKDKIMDISANGAAVPITNEMMESIIKMKADNIQAIEVEITEDTMTLQGKVEVKKQLLKKMVPFTIVLKPISLENRSLIFGLLSVKPVDLAMLNRKILNKPPFVTLNDREITMDLNAWEAVKKVPFGNIKSYEFQEGKIILKVGV